MKKNLKINRGVIYDGCLTKKSLSSTESSPPPPTLLLKYCK